MENLNAKKMELEKAFDEKKKYAQSLERDIVLIERLLATKQEHSKVMGELNEIVKEHGKVCEEIELKKAEPTDTPTE
jgi:hypothetical protein